MCRWLAYSGSPITLETVLFEPEHSLIDQSLHSRMALKRPMATDSALGGTVMINGRESIARRILPGTIKTCESLQPTSSQGIFLHIFGRRRVPLFSRQTATHFDTINGCGCTMV